MTKSNQPDFSSTQWGLLMGLNEEVNQDWMAANGVFTPKHAGLDAALSRSGNWDDVSTEGWNDLRALAEVRMQDAGSERLKRSYGVIVSKIDDLLRHCT